MQTVARFKKTDREEFITTYLKYYSDETRKMAEAVYDKIQLPTQKDPNVPIYEFHMPKQLLMRPGDSMPIVTGISVEVDPGYMMICFPEKSNATKEGMSLMPDVPVYFGREATPIVLHAVNSSFDKVKLLIYYDEIFMQAAFVPLCMAMTDYEPTVDTSDIKDSISPYASRPAGVEENALHANKEWAKEYAAKLKEEKDRKEQEIEREYADDSIYYL